MKNGNDSAILSIKSDFTASFCLKPHFSKRFALVLMILHGGTILLLLPLSLPLLVKLGIGVLVLISSLKTTRQHLLLIHHPLYGCLLQYNKQKRWLIVQLKSGQKAQIAYGSYNHPQLVVLRLKNLDNGEVNTLIIFPDALNIQLFRKLRVHLRHAEIPKIKTTEPH